MNYNYNSHQTMSEELIVEMVKRFGEVLAVTVERCQLA